MDINIKLTAQTTRLDPGNEGIVQQGASQGDLKPVLDGAGVTITQTTDFEKLMAELKLEDEEQKKRLLARSFASALTTLAGRYESISSSQAAALKEVSVKATILEKATQGVEGAQKTYDESVDRLEELKRNLTNQVDKEQKAAEEAAKKAAEEAAKKDAEKTEGKDGTKETGKTAGNVETQEPVQPEEPAKPKEDSPEVKKIKEEIAKQEKIVEANLKAFDAAKATYTTAKTAWTISLALLDKSTLLVVTDAVRTAARTIAAAAAEQPEGKEREEKANAIVQALGEYADKLEEMKDEELEEMIAKVSTDIVFLMRADMTVKPADLPEYEQNV